MILQKYEGAFRALTPGELQCAIEALARHSSPDLHELPDLEDGDALLAYCRQEHVSQAEVIMGLRNDTRVEAISAVEKLIMKPIDRRTPAEVNREREGDKPKPQIAAPVRASEAQTDTRIIRVLVAENPKRKGTASYERFARYRDGMSVAEFVKAGGTQGDLRWDQERGFVRLEEPQS